MVWKLFNKFFVRLDIKPRAWEDRLTLFVGHLISQNRQSSTVRSYISAIKSVLKSHNINIREDQYLLSSLTRACRLRNDQIKARFPIQKGLLRIILRTTQCHFMDISQPYLAMLYQTLFSTTYFGLFRVSEVTSGAHPILAKDVHIGRNKKKILFILHTSKTHVRNMPPQMVKIKSESPKNKNSANPSQIGYHDSKGHNDTKGGVICPYKLLRRYTDTRGGFKAETEPFFIFADGTPVSPKHMASCLKSMLRKAGFNKKYYGTHSLRAGRSCDLYRLGVPIETIKKLGRWKSNAVFRYLKT